MLILLLLVVWVSSERAAVCNRVVLKNEELVDWVVVNAMQLEIADKLIAAMAADAGKERRGFFILLDLCFAYYECISRLLRC